MNAAGQPSVPKEMTDTSDQHKRYLESRLPTSCDLAGSHLDVQSHMLCPQHEPLQRNLKLIKDPRESRTYNPRGKDKNKWAIIRRRKTPLSVEQA